MLFTDSWKVEPRVQRPAQILNCACRNEKGDTLNGLVLRLGRLCAVVPLFLWGIGVSAQQIRRPLASADSVKPLTDPAGNWVLIPKFSDEFNGHTLDTAKWDAAVPSWGAWSWDPKDVNVSHGQLHIVMRYAPHRDRGSLKYYKSGIIRSRGSIRYGYFQARIKAAPRFPGVAPAFWAAAREHGHGERTEIDFVELTQRRNPRMVDTNTHVFRHAGLQKPLHEEHRWDAPFDPRDGFHTYGCEWTPNWIRWYVDGRLVRTRKNAYWDQPLFVMLSMGVRPPLIHSPSKRGFPTAMTVDYIRVWQRGS